MIGNLLGIVLGLGAIALGCKGFTRSGLPFSPYKSITGGPAKVIGGVCILVGLGFLVIAIMNLSMSR